MKVPDFISYPSISKPFLLDADASNTGIGGVLSQKDDTREERVIAYDCHPSGAFGSSAFHMALSIVLVGTTVHSTSGPWVSHMIEKLPSRSPMAS